MANPDLQVVGPAFVAFAQSQRHSLQSLTLSSFENMDVSPIFEGLGHFPRLRELHILITITRHSLSAPTTRFMHAHKNTLEALVIQPNYHYNPSDKTFAIWVSRHSSTIAFPVPRSLKIELWATFRWTSVLPHAPRLVSLFITDVAPQYR
jgi:hypothetical protein